MSDDLSIFPDFKDWVKSQLFDGTDTGLLYFVDFYHRLSNDFVWCQELLSHYCRECLNLSLEDDERERFESSLHSSENKTKKIKRTNQKLKEILRVLSPMFGS